MLVREYEEQRHLLLEDTLAPPATADFNLEHVAGAMHKFAEFERVMKMRAEESGVLKGATKEGLAGKGRDLPLQDGAMDTLQLCVHLGVPVRVGTGPKGR